METLGNLAFGLGVALSVQNLIYCFIGCFLGRLVGAFFAPPLGDLALKFGPAEYFSLMVFGLIAAVVLARGSVIKAVAMVCFGILLGLVGTDVNSGTTRFAFGAPELTDGLGFVALAMAFFAITDGWLTLENTAKTTANGERLGSVLPSWDAIRMTFWAIS